MSNSEDFPNEVAQDMISMISPIYENSYVAQWIFHVMGENIGKAQATIQELSNEIFPDTATWTLPYWEEIYGLEKRDNLSVEERRMQILEKRNSRYSMNPARMAELLKKRYEREFSIIEGKEPYIFSIKTIQGKKGVDFTKLFNYVDNIKPSHLGYNVLLDMKAKFSIFAGFAVKEHKRIGIIDYIPTDPIVGIKCYTDEKGTLLSDEKGNLLVV